MHACIFKANDHNKKRRNTTGGVSARMNTDVDRFKCIIIQRKIIKLKEVCTDTHTCTDTEAQMHTCTDTKAHMHTCTHRQKAHIAIKVP